MPEHKQSTPEYGQIRRRKRKESDFQRIRRLSKRVIVRFINKHIAKLVFIGLPLLGMIAGIFVGLKIAAHTQATKLNDYGRKEAYVSYRVQSGDTVWNIASDLAALNPEYNDIRQYVDVIKETNGLRSGDIRAGETILIPYYISPNDRDVTEIYAKYGISR